MLGWGDLSCSLHRMKACVCLTDQIIMIISCAQILTVEGRLLLVGVPSGTKAECDLSQVQQLASPQLLHMGLLLISASCKGSQIALRV